MSRMTPSVAAPGVTHPTSWRHCARSKTQVWHRTELCCVPFNSWTRDHERWTRVGFVQLEFPTSWLKMAVAAVDDNQGDW